MRTIILKNNSNEEVLIKDLGKVIMPRETDDISDQFTLSELSESTDLKKLIEESVFTINDGENDLTIRDALSFLTVETAYEMEKRFNDIVEKKKEKSTTIASWWISLMGSISSIIAGVIANLTVFGIKKDSYSTLFIALTFMAVLVAFTQLLRHRQKGSSKVVNLKIAVESAFYEALENSTINPRNNG